MEEYQLLIMILLAFLSFTKCRQILQQSQHNSNKRKTNLTQLDLKMVDFQEDNVEPEEQPISAKQDEVKHHLSQNQPYEIPLFGIKKCIEQEALLFSGIQYKPDPYRASIITGSNDYNDIFGGQYNKCFEAKMENINRDTQPFIIHTRRVFSKFMHKESLKYRNQQLLDSVKYIIHHPYCFIDQPQQNNFLQQELVPNNFNNFSFNFNINNQQQSLMDIENASYEDAQSEKQVKLKKKQIKKSLNPKNIQGRLLNKKNKLLQPLKQQKSKRNERKRKWLLRKPEALQTIQPKRFICLQDQIKKKQQELQVLRRIYLQQQNQ